MLKLIQFNASKTQSQAQSHSLFFAHNSKSPILQSQIQITKQPNQSPTFDIIGVQETGFFVNITCQDLENLNRQNYYNHFMFKIRNKYQFSFLVNCDNSHRYKKFEIGYLIIGLINAFITIGVALHSRIWSIKFDLKPLRILLTWKKFLFLTLILICFGGSLSFIAKQEFKQANIALKYVGLIISFVFSFICFNQMFYLFKPLKKSLILTSIYQFRVCQLLSFGMALFLFILSLFVESWILYTFLACCICVGSIKMLYFQCMQQAFYSLAISVSSVTLVAIVLHYTLPRSYNDYASQLSSPMFIQVPDLTNNLFKKCSWLPVVDIIVPGVFLSFLRAYDQNFNTGWGGVYTIVGNVSFLLSTTLWIGIEAIYPFSVPFSLVTYSILLGSISLIAFKRNQLKTLWFGTFQKQNQIDRHLLKQDNKKNIQDSIPADIFKTIRMRDSISQKGDQEQNNPMIQPTQQGGIKSAIQKKSKFINEDRFKNRSKQV